MKLNVLLLVMISLFLSCIKGPEAEWIYGSWFEKLDGGEIEFKKGGTVFWFGKKGSFSFEKNKAILCMPRCKDGELKVKVGGDTFRFDYDILKGKPRPDSWTMSFENVGEMRKTHVIQGKKASALYLSSKREGTPYILKNVTRFDKGLFKYNNITSGGMVNGKMVAGVWSEGSFLFRYNQSSKKWDDISPSSTSLGILGGLHYGRNVILNTGLTSNKFSLDVGATWAKFPKISDLIGGKTGDDPTFLNKMAFQIASDQVEDGGDWSIPRPYRLYSVNLNQSKAKWKKAYDFPSDIQTDQYFLNLYTSEKVGDIYVFANPLKSNKRDSSLKTRMFRSQDKGLSFEEIAMPEFGNMGQAKAYDKGIVVVGWKREGDKNRFSLGKFHSETLSWNMIPLERDIYSWFPRGEEIFVYNWRNGLDRLNEDGSLMPAHYFEEAKDNNFQSNSISFIGDGIFFCSLTIWKINE
jgi:hypothetical protein